MYITRLGLQGIEETVERPIHNGIIRDIKQFLVIDANTKVFMDPNELNTDIDRTKDKLGQVRSNNSPRDEYLIVESEEVGADGFDIDLVNNTPGTYPIYYDGDVNAKILPVLHKRTVNMSIKYFNKSKSKVNAIVNRIRLMASSDGMYKTHTLEYHYAVDRYVLGLVSNINDLKNKRLTTALPLEDYIQDTFDNRVDYLNSLDGHVEKMSIAIREAQLEVLGYITDDTNNLNKEFESDSNGYSITINYSFSYDKPIALLMQYPIIVFNTPIDKRYRVKQERRLPRVGLRTRETQPFYEAFSDKIEKIVKTNDEYIHIPVEDNYTVPDSNVNYRKLFSVLTVVDETSPTSLFYLDEIPGIVLKDSIIEYIKADKDNLSKQYGGLFYFELYNYNKRQYNNDIVIEVVTETINGVPTERVKVSTTTPMVIKGEYRVVISILDKIFNMEVTRKDAMLKIIDTIDFKYKDKPIDTISNSFISMYFISTINEYVLMTEYITYIKDMKYPSIPKTVAIIGTVIK